MRTPRNQVARILRAQCLSRGRCCAHNRLVARMSRAQLAQVARTACACRAHAGRALVATRPGSLPQVATSKLQVTTPLRPLHVATSKRGRDTVSPAQPQARSQHQNQVATFLETNLCRDINFMSRPRFCPQWDFQVATSKMMSRPQIGSAPSLLRRDAIFPCRDLPCCHQCRDLKINVATSSRNVDFHVTTKDFLLLTSARS